jgi:hypothetical protein
MDQKRNNHSLILRLLKLTLLSMLKKLQVILTSLLIQFIAQPLLLTAHLPDGVDINGSQLQKKSQQSQELVITMPRVLGSSQRTLEETEELL